MVVVFLRRFYVVISRDFGKIVYVFGIFINEFFKVGALFLRNCFNIRRFVFDFLKFFVGKRFPVAVRRGEYDRLESGIILVVILFQIFFGDRFFAVFAVIVIRQFVRSVTGYNDVILELILRYAEFLTCGRNVRSVRFVEC